MQRLSLQHLPDGSISKHPVLSIDHGSRDPYGEFVMQKEQK